MANLRTNNLSGEQGKRAYRGSVFFDGRDDVTALQVIAADGNDDFTFGTGDFTIEMWINHGATGSYDLLYDGRRDGSTDVAPMIYLVSGVVNYYTTDGSGGGNKITGSSTLSLNSWHHIAISRASGSTKLFVNGVQEGSTYSDSNSYVAKLNRPVIGGEGPNFANNPFGGHLSNLRVVKGTALYTGTFTPPQEELTIVDGTVLLCCQDSDDTLQEATGKELLGQGGVYRGRRFSNLAVNGNLETGDTTNWTNGGLATFEVSTDHPHSGSYSLHCTSDSNGDACAYVIPVTLDTQKRYKISAYIKVVGPGGTSARAKMKIGSGTGGNENYESRTAGQAYSGLGNWTYVEWIGLATSDTTHVTFNESSANNVNDYFVDDLRIELWYPEEGENILANPNFYSTATGWSFTSTPSGEFTIASNKLSVADNSRTNDAIASQQLFASSIAEGRYKVTIDYSISSGDFDLGIGNNRLFGIANTHNGGAGSADSFVAFLDAGDGNSSFRLVCNQHNVGDFFNITLSRVAEPKAPKVIPPYGVDAGNAFGGPIQQSSQGYMCFPTGRTEERGRGRAVSWLGNNNSNGSYTKQIDFFDIQSTGTTTKFGEISDTVGLGAAMSSTTRGVFAGGTKPAAGNMNLLEFITIATTGNAVDFGGISTLFRYGGGISNSTRGLIVGAYQGGGASGTLNTIQFITIATLGNSADFGDIVANSGDGIFGAGTCSSSTRGITFGGGTPSSINEINSITIGTLGNSVDFGDLSAAKQLCQGVSSSTRGVVAGGDNSGAVNVIELITIASAGNATDFGDLPSISEYAGSSGGSNKIRGVFTGRGDYPAFDNSMQFITIATTGNASDFGDVSTSGGTPYGSSNVSDSHGGL